MESISKTKNGLVILSDVMKDVESVSLEVYVEIGSRHETHETSGISHFIEHMAFKGTHTRNYEQISDEFASIGGYFNACTSKEETVYFVKILKKDLRKAVDILADILNNSIFPEEEIEKERGPILEEFLKTEDDPQEKLFDVYHQKAFDNQPLGMPIIGTKDLILGVSRDGLKEYIKSRYGCDTMIVSAAGNLLHSELQEVVEDKFMNLQKTADKTFVTAGYTGGDIRLQKDLQQTHVSMGFPGIPYNSDDYYTQKVLTTILGGGMSSRLFREVREKRGLAYHISSFGYSHKDAGLFNVYFAASPSNVNEVISVTADQILALIQNVTEKELEMAKVQLKSGLLMSRESTSSRAHRLSKLYSIFQKITPIDESVKKIESITVGDISKMMKEILASGPLTFAAIGQIDNLMSYEKIQGCFI